MFKLKILPKYDSGKKSDPKQEGTVMSQLLEKIRFEREIIEPVLGELTPLYRHDCMIFISGKYVGKGYGTYSDSNENYDKVGNLLKTI